MPILPEGIFIKGKAMRFFPIEKFCQGAELEKHAHGVDSEADASKIDGPGLVFELDTLKKEGSSGF